MKQSAYMLLVDDEEELRATLQETLELANYHVMTASNATRAKDAVDNGKFDVAILDIRLPDGSGLDLLKSFKESDPDMGIILITGYSEVDSAVQAIELGADDFLKKPFEPDELLIRIQELLKKRVLKQENKKLKQEIRSSKSQHGLVGQCDAIQRIRDTALLLGDSDSTVLITGESGTGKEVLANMLHQSGSRADKPFVSINCGAIPEELLESELFGHVKGAFTGAVRARAGRFEVANGGTIFLDEIGDMSPKLQVKLLRVLQERTFEPVGSHQPIHIDVRVVAATHRDLEEEIEQGRFRQDLYYRLNVIPLTLPALREREDDVIILTEKFLENFNKLKNSNITGISDAAKTILLRYNWPGNVRELQNLVERVTTLKRSGKIDIEDLPSRMLDAAERTVQGFSIDVKQHDTIDFKGIVDEFESHLITSALDRFGWNKNQAAKFLSMNRTTLVEKIKKKGLVPSS
ncbi:sigma-54-dependent transcriptional regulator [Ghiorsea bivora]|uniref:sigma-54-dependent transcriptional regulator n=1 Tax=Ghiorsea bivora TaxID=1485545 RepID=UPI00056FCAB0|nr:sigma-54 dependent transcriptional regulator [Ghiorsea bivora]